MAKVVWIRSDGERVLADLEGKSVGMLGRRDDCDMQIVEAVVSGHHARFARGPDGWSVTDLESSNGTEVDGRGIGTARLAHGSRIILGGEIELRFVDPHPTPATKPSDGPPPPPLPAASEDDLALVRAMRVNTDRIRAEIAKVIVGQHDVIEQVLMVLVAGGHGLLVGMPGMAKTLLVSTIARVLDLSFKRIQFTPDLMPTDITGTEVLETDAATNARHFRFLPGPVFCNLLLADEINRTPPKTQAALLEAMQEKRVTVGNVTHDLKPPFFVLATQNPIEQEGTYPLPEAQQDRFMFNIWVDYPKEDEEELIVKSTTVAGVSQPETVLNRAQVLQLQSVVRKVPVSDHVVRYAIRLVRATRPADARAPDFVKQYVATGAGPRAGQFLILSAKARALLEGRVHVSCLDVQRAALPVLRHRILTNFAADSEGIAAPALIDRLLKAVEQPSEKDY
jgi:MoxR-like ATPase